MGEEITETSCLLEAIRKRKLRQNPGCFIEATKSYNDLQQQYEAKKRQEQSTLPQIESPSGYLQRVIFPYLRPAMEQMVYHAIRKNAFVDQKQAFDGIDYLAEVLWNKNPKYPDRKVKWQCAYFIFREKLCICHRPVYPFHWVLPKVVAVIWIQAWYRGCLVRKRPEVQEMRNFWKTIKEENWKLRIPSPMEEIRIPLHIPPNVRFL